MVSNNDLPITPPINDKNSKLDNKFIEELMSYTTVFPNQEYDNLINNDLYVDLNQYNMNGSLGLNIDNFVQEDIYSLNNVDYSDFNFQFDQFPALSTDSYNSTPVISMENNLINSPIIMTQPMNNYGNNENKEKPPYSYSQLITKAIMESSNQQLLLSEIYDWMINQFQYFKDDKIGVWKNSVRHNLSVNKCFKRAPRQHDQPGKGSYWTIDFEQLAQLDKRSKRRRFNPMKNIN